MKAGLSSEDGIPAGERWDLIYTDDFEVGAFRIVIVWANNPAVDLLSMNGGSTSPRAGQAVTEQWDMNSPRPHTHIWAPTRVHW